MPGFHLASTLQHKLDATLFSPLPAQQLMLFVPENKSFLAEEDVGHMTFIT
jgi:hypothetical protein